MGAVRLELLHGNDPDADGADRRLGPISEQQRTVPNVFSSQRERIIDGTLRCIARQGVAKSTLDDVAREARCSRATVYRAFPGGKDAVMAAVVDTEVSRFFSALAVTMGEATNIEDVLVAGMTDAARRVNGHDALAYLLEHEPEVVLPHLAFSHMDRVLSVSSSFIAPFLGRWLDHDEAQRVAEWGARIVLSYLACPAEGIDLTDRRSVRHFVGTFLVPGICVLRSAAGETRVNPDSRVAPSARTASSSTATGQTASSYSVGAATSTDRPSKTQRKIRH